MNQIERDESLVSTINYKDEIYMTCAWLILLAIMLGRIFSSITSVHASSFHYTYVNQQINTSSPKSTPYAIWVSPAVPPKIKETLKSWNIPQAAYPRFASLRLDVFPSQVPSTSKDDQVQAQSVWVYALVAPFPTIMDGVSLNDIKASWNGSSYKGPLNGYPLLMDDSTLAAFTALWGQPAQNSVKILPENKLLDTAWSTMPSWAIIPFESIQPRWKVLMVDGQSPIHKDFDLTSYPLVVNFRLTSVNKSSGFDLPASNRDPSKLTTVIMTGVTALTRATAQRMDQKGVTYPGRDIHNILSGADITHISNEVPFYSDCPAPDPREPKMVFCSSTRYIELLNYVGTDVVELTGNHFGDFGPQAMLESLKIYNDNGISHYGGGADLADSLKPLLLENHGNKIAFIGCNQPDVGSFPTATNTRPGAAPCDFTYMSGKIKELVSQGYFVITTFQWSEGPDTTPYPAQIETFHLMANSGAVIVNGSQAHVPQTMEFYNNSFLHYGLGNLFFDQMGRNGSSAITQREFIDRHVFYDGRYLGMELITAYLEDYSRPRLMTPKERQNFLQDYFQGSGWLPSKTSP